MLLDVFLSEFLGTMFLILLGVGVVATNLLTKSKGKGGGWLLINFGWGLAVFVGVYVAYKTGGHLNPAVTFGMIARPSSCPASRLMLLPPARMW